MKTKQENQTPAPVPVFWVHEKALNRATSEMQSYCQSCNAILDILRKAELPITAKNALELIVTPVDTLRSYCADQQRKALTGIPERIIADLIHVPYISRITAIQNTLTHAAVYNAGFIPRNFLNFENGKFEFDQEKLKDYFSVYATDETLRTSELVHNFLHYWEQLKNHCDQANFKMIFDPPTGLINFDGYKETFTENMAGYYYYQKADINRKKTGNDTL